MTRKKWRAIAVIAALLLIVGALGALIGPIMYKVEQPDYDVLSSVDNIEIRQYTAMIIAEVDVEGKRKDAIGKGFRILADYIFGNNRVKENVPMTAPVQQQAHEKIAMTAPVQQRPWHHHWKISFIMPAQYRLDTLPTPNNQAIQLRQLPAKRVIAIRFSGTRSKSAINHYENQLRKHIETHQIPASNSPTYAFYNPPWTLPFLRRNEIMFDIHEMQ